MQKIGIDFKNKRLLHNLYKNQNTKIRIDYETVNAKVKREVRQGCSFSSLLFNCYIKKGIKEKRKKQQQGSRN